MPATSEKQRKFMGAELARKRAGKRTKTGMSEEQLSHYARKAQDGYPEDEDISAAPAGSLREKLDQQRQGRTAYGPALGEVLRTVLLDPAVLANAYHEPSAGNLALAGLEVASLVPAGKAAKAGKFADAARAEKVATKPRARELLSFPSSRGKPERIIQAQLQSEDTEGQQNAREFFDNPVGTAKKRVTDLGSVLRGVFQ